jgi:hypothetical protein
MTLRAAGWVVLRLWEHQSLDETVGMVATAVTARQAQVAAAATLNSH